MKNEKRVEALLDDPDKAFASEFLGFVISGRVKSLAKAERLSRLAAAVENGDEAALKAALSAGVSPNDKAFDTSLVTRALRRRKLNVLPLLLAAGVDPNPRNGSLPLSVAAAQGDLRVTLALLDHGAKIDAYRSAALFNACEHNRTEILTLLLERGAKVNAKTQMWVNQRRQARSVTPLMTAAMAGHHLIVEQLLAAGAKHDAKDSDGCTAADWAKRCRDKEARTLVEDVLARAGSKSQKLVPRDIWNPSDFAVAARKPQFKKALRELEQLTNAKPQPLLGCGEKIAGGQSFAMEKNQAAKLVELHQAAFEKLDALIFASEGQEGAFKGHAVGILPTTDACDVVAAIGTAGPNSSIDNCQIVESLGKLKIQNTFKLVAVGLDFVEGAFKQPVKQPQALAKELARLCPDLITEGAGSVAKVAKLLKETRRFFLWWD